MIPDIDIYRATQLVIRQNGEDASVIAAGRADKLLEIGDVDGQQTWLRILAAVKELQRIEPGDSERVVDVSNTQGRGS